MAEITFVEAITMAMRRAMADDDRVVVLGQDVGVNGGVFRATQGLLEEFGSERVLDTPLAESMIAGGMFRRRSVRAEGSPPTTSAPSVGAACGGAT